jgi:hypothetical protein
MFINPVYYHNLRNISTIYVYNKTSIEVGRTKDLSAPP